MTKKQLGNLVAQLTEAKVQLDLAKSRYEEVAAKAREALDLGSYETDDAIVSVQVNRTWDKNLALEKYGRRVCTYQVDQSKARKVLTGKEFDALYNEGKNKIVVKVK